MLEHAPVQAREEIVEMHPLFLGQRQRLKETVQQPALTAPHRPVQVQATGGLAVEQVAGLAGHGSNRLGLPGAEGVALLLGFVRKKLGDGGVAAWRALFTKQATDQSRHGHCGSLCGSKVAHFRMLFTF